MVDPSRCSMAVDKNYAYLFTKEGLLKIGTGHDGTIKVIWSTRATAGLDDFSVCLDSAECPILLRFQDMYA